MDAKAGDGAHSWRSFPSANARQDRTLAPDHEEPHSLGKLLPARRSGAADRCLCRSLQQPPLSREPEQRHSGRRLLRT